MSNINLVVKDLILAISSTLQIANIYTFQHRETELAVERLYGKFRGALETTNEIQFGIVGNEIFFGKEVFFDLSKSLKDFIAFLKEGNIEFMRFKKGLRQSDLAAFLQQLVESRSKGTEGAKSLFKEKNFDFIEIGKFGEENKNEFFSGGLEKIDKKELNRFNHLLEGDASKAKLFLEEVIKGQEVGLSSLLELSSHILKILTGKQHLFFALMGIKKHHDYTFVHCINVATLTMFQARYLGIPENMTLRLGLSGFFHDIGKIAIKESIIDKQGKLDSEEFRQIKNHIVYGAKLLLKNKILDKLALIAAFQHHLGFHLGGYPSSRLFKSQNLASKLVCISDVYDALRSRRSYKKIMPLKTVYEIMQKEKGRQLDPYLTDLFFKNLGLWPVGTLVKLNSGEIALVIEANQEDIFRPKVNILYDQNRTKLDENMIFDLAQKDGNGKFLKEIVNQLDPAGEDSQIITEVFGEY